jgi:hypothetical protein
MPNQIRSTTDLTKLTAMMATIQSIKAKEVRVYDSSGTSVIVLSSDDEFEPVRPKGLPVPLIDVAYPHCFVDHLMSPAAMWAAILNSEAPPSQQYGIWEGVRFNRIPRYITNELDCFRQYPIPDKYRRDFTVEIFGASK